MKTIKILTLCLITTVGFAQNKQSKTTKTIKVNKDVVVDLNTNYVEIEIDTWNKDIVEIEAYVESTKLSEEELKKSLKAWNLNIDASMENVIISSEGGRRPALFSEGSYDDILKDLEFSLADLPDMPSLKNLPQMPKLPNMPKMPELPMLPELPEGVNTIKFDYDKYQKDGEKYLADWSKRYEKEGGKELQKRMEDWAKKFADSGYEEKMAKWGEEYGKRFEGKWAKDMEKWGEKFGKEFGESFGKDMEKWGEEFGEKFGKDMEKWGEELGERIEKQMEQRAEQMEQRNEQSLKRAEELAKRRDEMQTRRESIVIRGYRGGNSQVKRVIKIKMPKKAKLKLNVRHGDLKIVSAILNATGNISHTNLLAKDIDGSDTSINVSYSDVLVNDWKNGTLGLKYVDNALIKNVQSLTLNSNSSNINIDYLSGNNIIDGSFGELTIHSILDTFSNLNIVLENSDAWIKLPKVDYILMFKGERSKFNNEITMTKTVSGDSGKSIVINAKYSSVTTN